MTDANGLAAEANNRADATVITDQGSNGAGEIKVAGVLSEQNRALIEAKKWAGEDGAIDLEKIVSGYANLETHASKALKMPGEDATAEDWNAFYQKMGRPEKPDGYELKLNTELVPENFPYDEQNAIEFRNWAHEAGLTPQQAQKLHDKFVGHQAGSFNGMMEAAAKRESEAHRTITAQFGDPDSPTYKQATELMGRAVQQLGLKEVLVEAQVLSKDGAIRDARLATALHKVGKELYSEDTMATNANGVLSNPFSDGDSFNLTAQGKLLRDDPRKAKALIQAAGKKPSDFSL